MSENGGFDYDAILDRTLRSWEPDHAELDELVQIIDATDFFSPEGGERMKAAIDRYRQEELT